MHHQHHQTSSFSPTPPPPPPPPPATKTATKYYCCWCCYCPPLLTARKHLQVTSPLVVLAVCCLIVAYTTLGAHIFMRLERGGFGADEGKGGLTTAAATFDDGNNHPDNSISYFWSFGGGGDAPRMTAPTTTPPTGKPALAALPTRRNWSIAAHWQQHVDELRNRTVDKLWRITESLNILYRENWTRLAGNEVQLFQVALVGILQENLPPPAPLAPPSHPEQHLQFTGGASSASPEHAEGAEDKTTLRAAPHKWTFGSSFLYSLTLITTIGYGSVSTRTTWGRITTIVYTAIGIPLMLLYLCVVGSFFARNFRFLYAKCVYGSCWKCCCCCCCCSRRRAGHAHRTSNSAPPHQQTSVNCKRPPAPPTTTPFDDDNISSSSHQQHIPIYVPLLLLLTYLAIGAALFHCIGQWTVLEGVYLAFTLMTTIGFGQMLPKEASTVHNATLHTLATSPSGGGGVTASSPLLGEGLYAVYIFVGAAVVAMCINLAQADVQRVLRYFTAGHLGAASSARCVLSVATPTEYYIKGGGGADDEEISCSISGSSEVF